MKFEIVIAGGGFAGAYCARSLASLLGAPARHRVGLIAEQNIMTFQPMLPEVAAASLSPLDVVNPLRKFCRQVDVLRGKIIEIDLNNRRITLDAGEFSNNAVIEFEHLALALGNIVDLSRVPGMPEHARVMKNVGDALRFRAAIISRLEEANLETDRERLERLLTFVVVGGGYSGVETAGQILDFIEDVKPLYRNFDGAPSRVILVHGGARLMPEVSESLGRYAETKLRQRGMEILLNARATSMTAHRLYLDTGRTINTTTVLATVGNAPHPLLTELCKKHGLATEKGRIVTEPTLRVKGHDRLWAAGDCAAVPAGDQPACPPTAQFAQRQGKLLAENLARLRRGEPLRPFHHKNLGQLASIGHRTAVAEILGFRFSGFIAWFIWRTVYLFKLPGIQRKLRVMIDWTMDLFFSREISLLVPAPTTLLREMHLEKGDVVFHSAEPALSFYIVKDGSIGLFQDERLIRTLTRGQHFGARTLAGDGIWHFDAKALEPSTLMSIGGEAFRTLHQSSAPFHRMVAEAATPANAEAPGVHESDACAPSQASADSLERVP